MKLLRNAKAVTPSNTDSLGFTASYISVGTAGALVVDMAGGQIAVTINLPAGLFPISVTKVHDTGTTASGIAVYW